jgi:hypothetical protein
MVNMFFYVLPVVFWHAWFESGHICMEAFTVVDVGFRHVCILGYFINYFSF